jgi:tetratricopeptide (TPR) repeat protein
MFGAGWLMVRQVEEALKSQRLDEARRLLEEPAVKGHKASWPLLRRVAQGYLNRANRQLDHDEREAAWDDLLHAEQLGSVGEAVGFRQHLTRLSLAEVRQLLEACETGRALERVVLLRERSVRQSELGALEEVAREWHAARALADRGEFALAMQMMERIAPLAPEIAAVARFRDELGRRRDACAVALARLRAALDERHWREAIAAADDVLAVAIEHNEARSARLRAWRMLEPSTTSLPAPSIEALAAAPAAPTQRYMLWVDGVGGYLICLDTQVTLGQASPQSTVHVGLWADVSRLHATLTRDPDGYLLEAHRPVTVNGVLVERTLLQSGDQLVLGTNCPITFRQPVPVSATARLEMKEGQRTTPAADGVLMMAETLVLGSDPQSHILIPDLSQPVILFRQREGMGIRHVGGVWIDGQRCGERGTLAPTCSVRGNDFSFALEPVGARARLA